MGRRGARQLRRRVDCRLDVGKALQLRLEKGLTYPEIARLFNVSPQRVHQVVQPFTALLENPEATAAYRRHEAQLLDAVRMALLTNMADPGRLGKASVNNLAFAFRQVFDAARLLRNESTSNLGLRASLVLAAHGRPVPAHGERDVEPNG